MARPVRIKSVKVLHGFVVRLGLTDESERIVDLAPYLRGPIFQSIRANPAEFARVRVDHRAGTIVWPNGADIDPDVLCRGLEPCWSVEDTETASRLS